MNLSSSLFVNTTILLLLVLVSRSSASDASKSAEEARWLVQAANWGTLSFFSKEKGETQLTAEIVSYGETEGRVFLYLMGSMETDGALTLSEASLYPKEFEGARCGEDGNADPEDPRCAKLTISGKVAPCTEDNCEVGKNSLFSSHPEMKTWPTDHGFVVHELIVNETWIISNYGGGIIISSTDYYASAPTHHPAYRFDSSTSLDEEVKVPPIPKSNLRVPSWKHMVVRARWLVANSLWGTISTISVLFQGKAWGNIRSVVDGPSFQSCKGLPMFYLPTPDPTSIDVSTDNRIVLSFTEAALSERVNEDGKTCGGTDTENPTCARIHLIGKARALNTEEIEVAKKSFGARHPLASWLANGGAHTGGAYYTIDIEQISFLDYYGGAKPLSVEDYLAWSPASSPFEMTKYSFIDI